MGIPQIGYGLASTSSTGLTRFALPAEIKSAVTFMSAINPSNLKAAMGFTSMFESAQQTITPASNYSLAHGLGAVPKLVQVVLVCVTAELGYAVGDELQISAPWYAGSYYHGSSVWADATNVGVQMNPYQVALNRSSPGSFMSITNANWRMVARAWA